MVYKHCHSRKKMVYRLKVESDIVEKLGLGNNDELVLISVKTQLAAGINYFFKVTLIF